ncbi:uncharacterized protein ACHE_50633A [Neofusicoccum parvum]|nr:uncharacterized protein ACHE_50633A [Neofusicoccum parvum]
MLAFLTHDDLDLTTFRTRYGSYRYNVLPFGLCNGPATFQQYMNEVMMAGLDDFYSVFMDDILVYSKTRKEHREQPIFLEVDSSDYVSGGVLSQKDEEGKLHPVAYFSKKLSDTECNYTIYDKELFAIVFTDHETLKTFMTNKQLSRRQIRWAEELAEYNFKIIPITGKRNERADALSRREQDLPVDDSDSRLTTMNRTALPPGSFTLSPLEPLEDPDLPMELRAANRTDDALTAIRQDISKYPEYSVRDGLLVFQENRLVMPQDDRLRLRLIQAAHRPPATGHPGIQRTWELLKERYYWNGMKKAVKRYVQNCHSCKRAKYKTESYNGLLKPLPIGDQPWKHLSCDFVTKLPNCKGFTAVLVVVDRFSKMRHFIPCYDTTTASQMAQLFRDNIWKYHSLPDTIISDRGPQFISEFWQGLCKLLKIDHRLSTAYCNGGPLPLRIKHQRGW